MGPDFDIKDDLIVEVKGHPLARVQFDTHQYPALLSEPPQRSVAVLQLKPKYVEKLASFDALLGALEWIYVKPGSPYINHVRRHYVASVDPAAKGASP